MNQALLHKGPGDEANQDPQCKSHTWSPNFLSLNLYANTGFMHYVFESHTPTKSKAGQGNNYESEMMKGFLPDICLIRNKKLILFMFRLDALVLLRAMELSHGTSV